MKTMLNRMYTVGIVCFLALVSSSSSAQVSGTLTGTFGQPLSDESTVVGSTDAPGTVVDVYVAAGGTHQDICSDIASVWGQTANQHATLDARAYYGTGYTCHGSPFPNGVTVTGRLLLGNVLIKTDGQWKIPSGVEIDGIGVSAAAGSVDANTGLPVNTVIATSSSFGQGKAVLEMSSTSGAYGIKIRDLTVDCAPGGTGPPPGNCIGIENVNAGQNSIVEDVAIDNAPSEGLHVSVGDATNGLAAYSGPYRNITVQYPNCGANCNLSYGVKVDCGACTSPAAIPVHFDNITGQAAGTGSTKNGFQVVGVPVVITNSHFEEYLGMNIQIGDGSTTTNNVRIDNVSMGKGNGVLIMPKSYNVILTGVSGPSLTQNYVIVQNNYVTLNGGVFPQIVGPLLGYYMFGGVTSKVCGTAGNPSVAIPCEPLLDTSPVAAEWHTPAN